MVTNFKNRLKIKLEDQLPGTHAHSKLSPHPKRLEVEIPVNCTLASVLILLYQKDGTLYFPLITRNSEYQDDQHRGQIGLPGGRKDLLDHSLSDTALRECVEEIHASPESIEILGGLSPLYIPVSRHLVHPFVAYYDRVQPSFIPQEKEVQEIHYVSIDQLLEPGHRKFQDILTSNGKHLRVPTIQIDKIIIWGATAMILEEFSELCRPIWNKP